MPPNGEDWKLRRVQALDIIGPDGGTFAGEVQVRMRGVDWLPRHLKDDLTRDLLMGEIGGFMRVTLAFAGREVKADGLPTIGSLLAIRREIEPEGLRIRCYGASLNVFARGPMRRWLPSGQSKALELRRALNYDMLEGRYGYGMRLEMGRVPLESDWVELLATGPDVVPATIDEQHRFFQRWALGWGIKTPVMHGDAR